jgi:hypothetical protein
MSNRIAYFRFSCSQKSFVHLRSLVQKHGFTEKEDFGVVKFKNIDTYFSGVLVFKVPAYLVLADVENLTKIKKEQTYTYEFLPFGIDYTYQLLEIYSTRTKKYQIDDFFSEIGASGYGITDIEMSLDEMLYLIKKKQPEYIINTLGFKDFNLVQGITGRFNARITSNSVGKKMLSNYADSISTVDLNLNMEKEPLRLKLSSPTNIQFWVDGGLENEAILHIKRLFFKKIHTTMSPV